MTGHFHAEAAADCRSAAAGGSPMAVAEVRQAARKAMAKIEGDS